MEITLKDLENNIRTLPENFYILIKNPNLKKDIRIFLCLNFI